MSTTMTLPQKSSEGSSTEFRKKKTRPDRLSGGSPGRFHRGHHLLDPKDKTRIKKIYQMITILWLIVQKPKACIFSYCMSNSSDDLEYLIERIASWNLSNIMPNTRASTASALVEVNVALLRYQADNIPPFDELEPDILAYLGTEPIPEQANPPKRIEVLQDIQILPPQNDQGPYDILEILEHNKAKVKSRSTNKVEIVHLKELKVPSISGSSPPAEDQQ
ncbi:unnamed protein product [Callosobruchus maculatus]|uniref:Uncharacterized protein n=1 Tax=Callosobruchus maculatus TaxID=64391 RepID=A0A653CW24_CALMS|nr:unnamed protein product [Callosobruchus maculatus]